MSVERTIFEPEVIYEYCMKFAEDRNDAYRCGFRDGKVDALYLLGLISEEQYQAYEELIEYMHC